MFIKWIDLVDTERRLHAGLQAADNVMYMREAIESVSRRHGLVATFLPKPNTSWAGSGAHTHISIQDKDGKNLMGDFLEGLQGNGGVAESFVAGKTFRKDLCIPCLELTQPWA